MSSLHDIYSDLVRLVAVADAGEEQYRNIDSEKTHVESIRTDAEKLEKLESPRAAYRTLQQLAKELKPTIDSFFDSLSNDTEQESNDETSFRAMNAKLSVFLAFCPGIRMAYNLDKDAKRSDEPGT